MALQLDPDVRAPRDGHRNHPLHRPVEEAGVERAAVVGEGNGGAGEMEQHRVALAADAVFERVIASHDHLPAVDRAEPDSGDGPLRGARQGQLAAVGGALRRSAGGGRSFGAGKLLRPAIDGRLGGNAPLLLGGDALLLGSGPFLLGCGPFLLGCGLRLCLAIGLGLRLLERGRRALVFLGLPCCGPSIDRGLLGGIGALLGFALPFRRWILGGRGRADQLHLRQRRALLRFGFGRLRGHCGGPGNPDLHVVAYRPHFELGLLRQLDHHPRRARSGRRQRHALHQAVLDLQLALLGNDVGVGEVHHHPRRARQLQGGERERPVGEELDRRGCRVATGAGPEQPAMRLGIGRERRRQHRNQTGSRSRHVPGR